MRLTTVRRLAAAALLACAIHSNLLATQSLQTNVDMFSRFDALNCVSAAKRSRTEPNESHQQQIADRRRQVALALSEYQQRAAEGTTSLHPWDDKAAQEFVQSGIPLHPQHKTHAMHEQDEQKRRHILARSLDQYEKWRQEQAHHAQPESSDESESFRSHNSHPYHLGPFAPPSVKEWDSLAAHAFVHHGQIPPSHMQSNAMRKRITRVVNSFRRNLRDNATGTSRHHRALGGRPHYQEWSDQHAYEHIVHNAPMPAHMMRRGDAPEGHGDNASHQSEAQSRRRRLPADPLSQESLKQRLAVVHSYQSSLLNQHRAEAAAAARHGD